MDFVLDNYLANFHTVTFILNSCYVSIKCINFKLTAHLVYSKNHVDPATQTDWKTHWSFESLT